MTPTAPTTPVTRSMRTRLHIGIALTTLGVLALTWVGWQLIGTTAIAHRHQRENLAAITKAWTLHHDHATTPVGPAGAILRIPAFGPHWRMPIIESVSETALAQGVGHFPHTAAPGGTGNYALAAHRITHGEPFRDLPDLHTGDKVLIETRTAIYTYRLDTTGTQPHIVPFTDTSILDPHPTGSVGRKVLTLMTCAELFHTDNRLVLFGHLTHTTPR